MRDPHIGFTLDPPNTLEMTAFTLSLILKKLMDFGNVQVRENSRAGELMFLSHVGKYDWADDRPKLAMLSIDIGPMIDRGLDNNCGPILACYIGPKIAPDYRPRITARVKPTIFQIYDDINNDNKI